MAFLGLQKRVLIYLGNLHKLQIKLKKNETNRNPIRPENKFLNRIWKLVGDSISRLVQ